MYYVYIHFIHENMIIFCVKKHKKKKQLNADGDTKKINTRLASTSATGTNARNSTTQSPITNDITIATNAVSTNTLPTSMNNVEGNIEGNFEQNIEGSPNNAIVNAQFATPNGVDSNVIVNEYNAIQLAMQKQVKLSNTDKNDIIVTNIETKKTKSTSIGNNDDSWDEIDDGRGYKENDDSWTE